MKKEYYSEFLAGHQGKYHFAGHSHHFWPNVARLGHIESYDLAMKTSDHKWDYIFSTLVPDVQNIISGHLNFSRPSDISFASNTHELITKLISSKFHQDKIKILTTTHEFHSMARQLKRFDEEKRFDLIQVNPDSTNFEHEISQTLEENTFDFIIVSHVFFNTGKRLSNHILKQIIKRKQDAIFILDGYHHYCALPFDLSPFEDDLYYLAGSYKYAQAGEGMCFMTLPKNCELRPLITGWFAGFSSLEKKMGTVDFENNGMRFWGSTMDMTAFFRFRSVWNFFNTQQITIDKIHLHVRALQKELIKNDILKKIDLEVIGHFISLKLDSTAQAKALHQHLLEHSILTDFRGNFIRFGLTPYLDIQDVEILKQSLNSFKFN